MESFMWEGSNEDAGGVAVLLPGAGYSVQGPLLHWCARLLIAQGWRVQAVEWTMNEVAVAEPTAFVDAALLTAFEAAPDATARLVVGKSFGSHALGWAVAHDVPGVWLSPVLDEPTVAEALARADGTHLAIGGNHDDLWLPDAAAGSGAEVITVAGADHNLEIAGDWRASVAAQVEVHEIVERHVRRLATAG